MHLTLESDMSETATTTETKPAAEKKKPTRRKATVAPGCSFFLDQEDGLGNQKRRAGDTVNLTARETKALQRFLIPYVDEDELDEDTE